MTAEAHRRGTVRRPSAKAVPLLKGRLNGHYIKQRQRKAHLRADHRPDQGADHGRGSVGGGRPALHAAAGQGAADIRHHHQAGLRGAGAGRFFRERPRQGLLCGPPEP